MKYILTIISVFVLTSCVERIVETPTNYNTESMLLKIFKSRGGETLKKPNNNPHESDVIKIVRKISNVYYGNENHIKVFSAGRVPAQALPFNHILLSKEFLNYISRFMSYEEKAAVLCHESIHILNNDWKQRILKEHSYSYIDATGQWSSKTRASFYPKTYYNFVKKVGFIRGEMSYKEYVNFAQENFKLTASGVDDKYVVNSEKGEVNNYKIGRISLTDSQGFPLSVEMKADKEALNCLKMIGVNEINMLKILNKINKDKFTGSSNRLNKRIRYLTSILRKDL